jgi:tetratricopeptide (TPR) repeat protein
MADNSDSGDEQADPAAGAPEALADAIRLHQDGRMDEAIAAYHSILGTDPDDAATLSALGVALRAVDRNGEALEVLARGAERHPDHADLAYNLGNARRDAGEADAAILCYRQALGRNPAYLGAATNLALVLNGAGRNREAAEVCTKALVLHPMQAELYTNLGVAHWYLGSTGRRPPATGARLRSNPARPRRSTIWAWRWRLLARPKRPPRTCAAPSSYRQNPRTIWPASAKV